MSYVLHIIAIKLISLEVYLKKVCVCCLIARFHCHIIADIVYFELFTITTVI